MRIMNIALVFVVTSFATSATAETEDFQAYAGRPFGVARLKILESQLPRFVPANGQTSWDSESIAALFGQPVLYPVVRRNSVSSAEERSWNIHFLFQGVDDIAVRLPSGNTVVAHPLRGAGTFNSALKNWWSLYQATAISLAKSDQYPAEIEQYLTMMLSSRCGKKAPDVKGTSYVPSESGWQIVAAISGTESIRLAMQKDAYLRTGENVSVANQPLPGAASLPAVEIPKVDGDVAVEPIANVVPHECFYVRFGSFSNFLWARDRFAHWGTDFRNMASARSVDYRISERLQEQLNLDDSKLSGILGPAVVRDVAAIGSDLFLREGAAVGIVFEASNSSVLSASIQLQREASAALDEDVSLQMVQLPGHRQPVSLLSSSDNRVRSFYVVHGDFHLVTTSRTIATRFLDVATGVDVSLGATAEFRYARHLNSVDRDDSAFIYLSDRFFRQVVNPAFRIEMNRRAKSEAEIHLVQYAQLSAAAEGVQANSIQDLVAGKYLPAGFLKRGDGTRLEIQDGRVIDSLRGSVGSFLPIADVDVTLATKEELAAYSKFAQEYARVWQKMDPATIAFSRIQEGNRERIVMNLHVFPVPQQTYGLARMILNEKTAQRLVRTGDCLVMVEAEVAFGAFGSVFLGSFDSEIPFTVKNGLVREDSSIVDRHPFFLGAPPGVLQTLLGKEFDVAPGEYCELNGNGFKVGYNGTKFSLAASSKKTIDRANAELSYEKAERECQLRVHIGDFANTRAVKIAHAKAWESSNKISSGNSRFLTRLATQFHLPTGETMTTAEKLLGGTPVCPFDGQYVRSTFDASPSATGAWSSTKFVGWEEYKFPFFEHFHGAEVELNIDSTTLTTRVEFVLDLPPATASRGENATSDVVDE